MTPTTTDRTRQAAVVLTALAFVISSQIATLTGTGRTIESQSDISANSLVPPGIAFAIWGVIFAGMLAYAATQALRHNATRRVFRETGWWLAAAMALSTAWALAASYAPLELSNWLTALIFVPFVLAALVAMRRATALRGTEDGWTRFVAWVGPSLLAGWVALAVFLNWEQVLVGQLGLPALPTALGLLAAALLWIAATLWASDGNPLYALPSIWGLGLLAWERLGDGTDPIGLSAAAGALAIAAVALFARRYAPPLTAR